MSVTFDGSVVFSGYSGFLHQFNWPPQYNWNMVESGINHFNPNSNPYWHIIEMKTHFPWKLNKTFMMYMYIEWKLRHTLSRNESFPLNSRFPIFFSSKIFRIECAHLVNDGFLFFHHWTLSSLNKSSDWCYCCFIGNIIICLKSGCLIIFSINISVSPFILTIPFSEIIEQNIYITDEN